MTFELIDEKQGKVHYAPKPAPISYPPTPDEGIAHSALKWAQTGQQYLDLSCFAERWWQESLGWDAEMPGDPQLVPWRPVWASRRLEYDGEQLNPEWHYAGENQVCLVCDLAIEEPNTLCDSCGEAFATLYLQRYGVDLQRPANS